MPAPTEEDWKAFEDAHVALKPDEKLVKTKNYHKYYEGACPYKTRYSFVNIKGNIVAMDFGPDALIGKGAYGSVKKGYLRDGSYWAVKMERLAVSRESNQFRMVQNENHVLGDLTLGGGYAFRDRSVKLPNHRRYKYYTLMRYLGISLFDYLRRHKATLSDAERLELAVDLSVLLAKLHRGDLSSTKTPWAHLDLKPTNVTIDKEKKLHAIDFAFSEKNIHLASTFYRGTPIYMPHDCSRISKELRDVFGLLRTLYVPITFYNGMGKQDRRLSDDEYVLTGDLIGRINLADELLTDAARQLKGLNYRTAGEIAALLILASLDLQCLYKCVNKTTADTIIECYEAAKIDAKKAVKEAIQALFHPDVRFSELDSSTHKVLTGITEHERPHDGDPSHPTELSDLKKPTKDLAKKEFKTDLEKAGETPTVPNLFFKAATGATDAGVKRFFEIYQEPDGTFSAFV